MELKEVVNLRRLGEWYEEEDDNCMNCPFRNACGNTVKCHNCFLDRILFGNGIEKDLYDMEADGTLTEDYQL